MHLKKSLESFLFVVDLPRAISRNKQDKRAAPCSPKHIIRVIYAIVRLSFFFNLFLTSLLFYYMLCFFSADFPQIYERRRQKFIMFAFVERRIIHEKKNSFDIFAIFFLIKSLHDSGSELKNKKRTQKSIISQNDVIFSKIKLLRSSTLISRALVKILCKKKEKKSFLVKFRVQCALILN